MLRNFLKKIVTVCLVSVTISGSVVGCSNMSYRNVVEGENGALMFSEAGTDKHSALSNIFNRIKLRDSDSEGAAPESIGSENATSEKGVSTAGYNEIPIDADTAVENKVSAPTDNVVGAEDDASPDDKINTDIYTDNGAGAEDDASPDDKIYSGIPTYNGSGAEDDASPDNKINTDIPTDNGAGEDENEGSKDVIIGSGHSRYSIPEDITGVTERYEYLRDEIMRNKADYDAMNDSCEQSWCFRRTKDHSQPEGYENFKITDYNGYYIDKNVSEDSKVIYLTFDCGYPSDLTDSILNTLSKHNAKANFFVTKMYLKQCADYAIRMKEDGHLVCNHTVSHSNMVGMSVEKICKEIFDCADYFYEVTGYTMDPYLRTPEGNYSKRLMSIISDAGYTTVFWSIAYGDYDANNQPKPGYVLNYFKTNHHNGAIALLHNDSTSNANELDDVLTMLENEGYRFALLTELEEERDAE